MSEQRDWVYQDHGLRSGDCFVTADDNGVEQAMVRNVLAELMARNVTTEALEKSLAVLVERKKPGNDPAWKSLKFTAKTYDWPACGTSRDHRQRELARVPTPVNGCTGEQDV